MVNYSSIYPLSEGGPNGLIIISESSAINTSGFYSVNDLVTDIGLDVSSLPDSSEFVLYNQSTRKAILYGIESIDALAIPENKGVVISPSIVFWGYKSNNSLNSRSGQYSIDWQPGYTPPYITFSYGGAGSNGVIYYLGATKYNSSFLNPVTRGELAVTASSQYDANRVKEKVFTKSNTNPNYWHSATEAQGRLEIDFKSKTFSATGFELWASADYGLNDYMGANCNFQASNNGTNWTDLLTFSPMVGSGQRYYSGNIPNPQFYRFYRFVSFLNYWHIIGDIEMWGLLME